MTPWLKDLPLLSILLHPFIIPTLPTIKSKKNQKFSKNSRKSNIFLSKSKFYLLTFFVLRLNFRVYLCSPIVLFVSACVVDHQNKNLKNGKKKQMKSETKSKKNFRTVNPTNNYQDVPALVQTVVHKSSVMFFIITSTLVLIVLLGYCLLPYSILYCVHERQNARQKCKKPPKTSKKRRQLILTHQKSPTISTQTTRKLKKSSKSNGILVFANSY
ncbi:hypothetical protein B9Z55_024973 [Caenorhabditis nigoni]|uniref:Uncharacterized protein n=1 Tax=Caenorhabditis nigoni TaxID=1611254 RepID=A0A2G5SWQ8_9PELO|nr:hypothetical protein B9Z55_024973 [Caenorhabditis nigoni]